MCQSVFLKYKYDYFLSAAVSDSERVEVKSGENVTLRVETPGNVRKAMLEKCEDGTGAPIIRYCSPEEEKRGCSVKKSDRFSIRSDTESLSVNFSDARVSDEGCYTVSYIDNFNIWKKKLFEVTVSGEFLLNLQWYDTEADLDSRSLLEGECGII